MLTNTESLYPSKPTRDMEKYGFYEIGVRKKSVYDCGKLQSSL